MVSSLEQLKDSIIDLYNKDLGAPEIVRTLELSITPRSVQRYLKKLGIVRDVKTAIKLSEPRRQQTIQERWRDYEPVKRKGISPSKRYKIFARDNFKCTLCGATVADGARLEIDHIIAVIDGGTYEMENLHTVCARCNQGKYRSEHPDNKHLKANKIAPQQQEVTQP